MITWAYLAGFLDGDGWISFCQEKHSNTRKRCTVGLTQKATRNREMTKIVSFLKGNGIRAVKRNRQTDRHPGRYKPTLMINVIIREQVSLEKFLTAITPYLLIKQKVGKDTLQYLRNRLEKRGRQLEIPKYQTTKVYWTPREIDVLRRLVTNGYSARAIAHRLNRSMHSITTKLHRLNLGIWENQNAARTRK